MDFTFGIITAGGNDAMISEIIESIHAQNIPNYEIIIVGYSAIQDDKTRVIPFDESQKRGWITRKKNIVNQEAKYEFVCHLHDYVKLCDDWYKGFLRYGSDFDYGVTRILTNSGRRFRDFCVFPFCLPPVFQETGLIPYGYKPSSELNKVMYISGTYFIIRKSVALQYPLNELLCHGQGEDVELSQRLTRAGIPIQCNHFSTVQFMKYKDQCHWEKEIDLDELEKVEKSSKAEFEDWRINQSAHLVDYLKSFGIRI
jgi:hypothetical protein